MTDLYICENVACTTTSYVRVERRYVAPNTYVVERLRCDCGFDLKLVEEQ